jgi:hypothetical protein
MVLSATFEGLRRALRTPRLAVVVWLFNLVLAAGAGVPGWLALRSAIGPLPEADRLRDGMSLLVLSDLAELRPGLLAGLGFSVIGLLGLGVLAGALVTAGALEVLISRDDRPLRHRFGRGAFRFFGRFLRAGLGASLLGALAAGLALVPFVVVGRRVADSAWEPARFVNGLAGMLVAFLALLLALVALDAARVVIVRDDAGAWRALRAGLRLVLGHPLKWLAAWTLNALLVAAAFAAYLSLCGSRALSSGAPVIALFALQQAFVLARSWLRVALLGTSVALVDRLRPVPPQPPAALLEPAAVPAALPVEVALGSAEPDPAAAVETPAGADAEKRPR